jgi:1-phosphofructokinase
LDDLCNAALVAGLESDVVVLGGPDDPRVLAPGIYRRLAADLGTGDVPVVADLSGPFLSEAVAGGVTVAKASHEDLVADGRAASVELADLRKAATALAEEGAGDVVLTRADEPALALVDGRLLEVRVPALQRVDHRGAGDAMTAGIAAALARGQGMAAGLRLGAAAGALNATRHGLATGEPGLIHRMAERVIVEHSEEQ